MKDNAGLTVIVNSSISLDTTEPAANAGQTQTVTQSNRVTFDASESTDISGIISYIWDFGDGSQGSGVETTHTYSNSGTYTAKLTVQDLAGNTATTQVLVIIQPQTTPTPSPTQTSTSTPLPTRTPTASPAPTENPTPTAHPTQTAYPTPSSQPTITGPPSDGESSSLPIGLTIAVTVVVIVGMVVLLSTKRNKKR